MKNLFVLLAIVFSFMATSFTAKAQAPQVGKTYYIQSAVSSSRFLSTKNGGTSTKTRVVIDQKTSRNLKATQWTMVNAGRGYYKFIQKASNKALDVSGVRTAPKTPLWIWSKSNPGEAQKFRLQSAGHGHYYIIPKINTALRVDVEGASSRAGTGVWTFSHNGSPAQKWKFIEVSSAKQARYRVEFVSMYCIEEDDPGSEVEIFGNIKARVFYNGTNRNIEKRQERIIWRTSSQKAIDLEEREVYNARNAYFDFTARKDYMESGSYTIDLLMDLYEHDGSSSNDQFGYGAGWGDVWKRNDGLPKTNSVTISEGDTRILVKWTVKKLGDL